MELLIKFLYVLDDLVEIKYLMSELETIKCEYWKNTRKKGLLSICNVDVFMYVSAGLNCFSFSSGSGFSCLDQKKKFFS